MTKRQVPNWGVDALRTFRRFLQGRYHHGTAAFFEEGASDLEKMHVTLSRMCIGARRAVGKWQKKQPRPGGSCHRIPTRDSPGQQPKSSQLSSADAQDHQT
jgi:hypothetical protein